MPDLVGGLALLALLVTGWRHPRPVTEALVAVLATGAVLAVRLVPPADAADAVRRLLPVLVFLAGILVVAEVCSRAGVFVAAAGLVRGPTPGRLLLALVVLAALVTAVLSLDATVVLLTPVALAAARARGFDSEPATWACLRMANSASLLLPVSNLTNLLAAHALGLTFLGFAREMAPVWVAVVAVEWLLMKVLLRAALASTPPSSTAALSAAGPAGPAGPVAVPVAVVLLMLVGFAALSPLGVEPAWVCVPAAVLLVGWAARRGLLGLRGAARATHPSFALFVLALGVVVAGLADGRLGETVADLLPARTDFWGLLAIAAVATGLANVVTNLSATLLLVPLVAPLGSEALLAALVGLGAGAGLTYTGSLANLLWRRTLTREGEHASLRRFHALSLVSTPVVVVVGVAVLHLT